MKHVCVLCACAVSSVLLVTPRVDAQAPSPTFGVNNANRNVSPYVGIVSNPFIRWQTQIESSQIDNPGLIIDGRGYLYAPYLTPRIAATGQPAGINFDTYRDSTPAIGPEGNIYQWEHGFMHAYAPNGSQLWAQSATGFSDGRQTRVGPDGLVYATGGSSLMAFNATGQVRWTVNASVNTMAIDGAGNIYTASNGFEPFRSYDSNGNLRWQMPTWGSFGSTSWNAPILGPDGNLYLSGDYGTSIRVVNPTTGAVIRQQANLYGGVQAITQDGTLYSCSYQTVRATDLFGVVRWQATVPSNVFLENLTVDAAGHVYCVSEGNQVFAFSSTGTQMWSMQLAPTGIQHIFPVIGSDGTLYVAQGGLITAIAPAPGAGALLGLGLVVGCRRRRR